MGEYQDIRRPEPPTYRGYTVPYDVVEHQRQLENTSGVCVTPKLILLKVSLVGILATNICSEPFLARINFFMKEITCVC